MKKKRLIIGGIGGATFILLTVSIVTALSPRYKEVDQKLIKIEKTLREHYIGELEADKMEEGVYKGFVAAVGDPYTMYYTPDEYNSLMEKTSGVYAGIGVQMTVDKTDNTILIVEVFPGSPAEEAGMLPKDKIIGAEGISFTGDDFDEVPNIIKGEEGTRVEVEIFRPSENQTYLLDIERASIVYPSVDYEMLQDDIGYIHIRQFEDLTHEQFKAALDDLIEQEAKGIVLDLRNNPGGVLGGTVKIADELLPEGIVLTTEDNMGRVREYKSGEDHVDIPLVVLVNEQSASASEVLSGALKDHNRAKIVGTRTVGKGIVQTILPLTDGSAMKVTTSEYFIPSGVSIQGVGVEPDYYVELPPELLIKSNLEYEEDLQLQKGVEILMQSIH